MRVSSVIFRVSDLDRAVEFWSERVGLAIISRVPGFTFFDGGSVQLVLNLVDTVPESGLTELVIEVDDVVAVHRDMVERGVPFEVGLRPVAGDGKRELHAAHFRDPDGNLASLTGWISSS